MGRGFACVVLAAVLASSAAGSLLLGAPSPTSGGPIKIWEGYARGWVTVTQVDITYDRGGGLYWLAPNEAATRGIGPR